MSNMKARFVRALDTLKKEFDKLSPEDKESVLSGKEQFCGRWLRNEAELWTDYEEDLSFVVDGVQTDPNHPDNLSYMVISWFLYTRGGI